MSHLLKVAAVSACSLLVTACGGQASTTPPAAQSSATTAAEAPTSDAAAALTDAEMTSQAEQAAKDALPANVPIWEGATFKGTKVDATTVCVDRAWGPKGGIADEKPGSSAGHVMVTFPDKSLGEPQDGTCAESAIPMSTEPVNSTVELTCTPTEANTMPFSKATVTVTMKNGDVRTQWKWKTPDGNTPWDTGEFGLYVMASQPRGGGSHQYGWKAIDGTQSALYISDLSHGATQENLSGIAKPTATGVEMTFPGGAQGYVNNRVKTTATIAVTGVDVANCER